MRKINLAICSVVLAAITVAGSVPVDMVNAASPARLNKKKIVLVEGQKKKIKVKGSGKLKYRFVSKNSSVAKVGKKNGKIKAVAPGKTVIKAVRYGHPALKCKVVVKEKIVSVAPKNSYADKKGLKLVAPEKIEDYSVPFCQYCFISDKKAGLADILTEPNDEVSWDNKNTYGKYKITEISKSEVDSAGFVKYKVKYDYCLPMSFSIAKGVTVWDSVQYEMMTLMDAYTGTNIPMENMIEDGSFKNYVALDVKGKEVGISYEVKESAYFLGWEKYKKEGKKNVYTDAAYGTCEMIITVPSDYDGLMLGLKVDGKVKYKDVEDNNAKDIELVKFDELDNVSISDYVFVLIKDFV